MRAHQADFGIALDGDADRLQMVDARGPPVQRRRAAVPDGRSTACARGETRARRGRHADDQHGGRAGAARQRGVEFVRAKVGDRYVLEELEKRGWLLGGEGSGHLLALDKHTTGDGLDQRAAGAAGLRAQRQDAVAVAGGRDACSRRR